MSAQKLAVQGGPKAVTLDPGDLFAWPIITEEDDRAVLEVLHRGAMSDTDVTEQFEAEFARWQGVKFALAHNNGTSALHSAMFGLGLGVGDEIISPSVTIWASCIPAFSLGATMVFADIDPETLCIDPDDIEHRITERTKAIVVVHYCGMPCDMDPIMEIARRNNVKVIEDVSHAHGARYKGRMVGAIGDVAGMSFMSGKSFAAGEGGMLATNDETIYRRAVALGHYERTGAVLAGTEFERFAGVPLGGYKYRMHQLSSVVARGQLAHYDERMADIQKALNTFWDLLEGVPGLRAHRPPKGSGTTMGGWYAPRGLYVAEELGGLAIDRFREAVRAEGMDGLGPPNFPLHLHPALNECDIYGHGKPTRLAHTGRDLRQGPGSLPVSEGIADRCFAVPYFRRFRREHIEEHANAFRKVAEHAKHLLSS